MQQYRIKDELLATVREKDSFIEAYCKELMR